MTARFDFRTGLDASAFQVVEEYLHRLVLDVDGVRDIEVVSIRRLARGQVRVDVSLRMEREHRGQLRRSHVENIFNGLVGSARYMSVGGRVMPLARLYRTRLLS